MSFIQGQERSLNNGYNIVSHEIGEMFNSDKDWTLPIKGFKIAFVFNSS